MLTLYNVILGLSPEPLCAFEDMHKRLKPLMLFKRNYKDKSKTEKKSIIQ